MVDVVVIQRVEALAVVSDARIKGRVEPEQMIGPREDMT
jgi:hypothetical protein